MSNNIRKDISYIYVLISVCIGVWINSTHPGTSIIGALPLVLPTWPQVGEVGQGQMVIIYITVGHIPREKKNPLNIIGSVSNPNLKRCSDLRIGIRPWLLRCSHRNADLEARNSGTRILKRDYQISTMMGSII